MYIVLKTEIVLCVTSDGGVGTYGGYGIYGHCVTYGGVRGRGGEVLEYV